MDLIQIGLLLAIGGFAGLVSSLMGVGGGIVVVPLLTLLLGMSQKSASATSLAMLLPPIGVFAVVEYYNKGLIDLRVAGIMAIPFAVGALLGAKYLMPHLNEQALRLGFSGLLVYAAVMVISRGQGREREVLMALLVTGGWLVGAMVLRRIGRRMDASRPVTVAEAYHTRAQARAGPQKAGAAGESGKAENDRDADRDPWVGPVI